MLEKGTPFYYKSLHDFFFYSSRLYTKESPTMNSFKNNIRYLPDTWGVGMHIAGPLSGFC